MNLKDLTPHKAIRGIAIGRPKSGKTVGLTSFTGKTMIFDIDKRAESVLKMRPDRKNIYVEQYGVDDYEMLERDINIHCNDRSYGMYILDSITSLSDMLVKYSMKMRGMGKDARLGRTKGKIILPEVEDYGAESSGLVKIIDALLSIDHAHVFVTAHILRTTAWDLTLNKEIVQTRILTAGKPVASKIPTKFNEIWGFAYQPAIAVGQTGKFFVNTVPTIEVPDAGSVLNLSPQIEFTMPKFDLWSQVEASIARGLETKNGTA